MLVVALTTIMSFSAHSETPQLEIVAGMNVSNHDASDARSRIGFHAGIRSTFGFPSVDNGFYVNAAALISLKGCKADGITSNPYYLDIPLHAGYKYAINESVAIFGELGPYFGIGLWGLKNHIPTRPKLEDYDDMLEYEDDLQGWINKYIDGPKNTFSEKGYKRFDFGLGVRAGIEFSKKIPVSIGYDFGVIDLVDEVSAKTRNLTVSIGYKF